MNERELMKMLVSKAKSYSLGRVPAISLEGKAGRESAAQLIDDWAEVLKLWRFPPKLWGEAVQKWAMNPAKEFVDPGVLQHYAYKVRDEWEATPRNEKFSKSAETPI